MAGKGFGEFAVDLPERLRSRQPDTEVLGRGQFGEALSGNLSLLTIGAHKDLCSSEGDFRVLVDEQSGDASSNAFRKVGCDALERARGLVGNGLIRIFEHFDK